MELENGKYLARKKKFHLELKYELIANAPDNKLMNTLWSLFISINYPKSLNCRMERECGLKTSVARCGDYRFGIEH